MPSIRRKKYVRLNGKDPENIEDGTVPGRSETNKSIDELRQTLKPGREVILKEGGPFSGEPRDILVYKSRTGIMYRVINFKGPRNTWKYFRV